MPAAFAIYLLTSLAAPFFLSVTGLENYLAQLLGAVTFTANFVLYSQTGYFDRAAEFQPLLHIWSLSLEEQFCIVLPLLLFLSPRRFWPLLAILVVAASAGLCAYFLVRNPTLAFYMLPTRAWELGLGVLVALLRLDAPPPPLAFRLAFWPALASVVVIPFLPTGLPHPGLDAALVCVGTAIVIINARTFFASIPPFRAVARVGDASYSLYLAHWPVLAFLNNAYLGATPTEARFWGLAVAVLLGLAVYLTVERPTHFSRLKPTLPATVGAAVIATGVALAPAAMGLLAARAGPDYSALRAKNHGLGEICDQGGEFRALPSCATGEPPAVAVWGDSHAMHLVPGLLAAADLPLVQLTRSSCTPAIGYSLFDDATQYNQEWADRCVEFNRQTLSYLADTPSIDIVVIGATFGAYTAGLPWQAIRYDDSGSREIAQIEFDRSADMLVNLVETLEGLGKRVVIFLPTPSSGRDIGECVERVATGLLILGSKDCSIDAQLAGTRVAKLRSLFEAVREQTAVTILDPRTWMCDAETCEVTLDGVPLYRDHVHLSVAGSGALGRRYHWDRLIGWDPARRAAEAVLSRER